MRTIVLDPPPELQSWLERRQRLGHDLFDEVWAGVYHVAPAPGPRQGRVDDEVATLLKPYAVAAGLHGSGPLNIGVDSDDYRVPDRAYYRDVPTSVFVPSVPIVVEIVSPRDETWTKLDFYYARGVDEVLIVDPDRQQVQWLARGPTSMEPADGSALLGLSSAELAEAIDWPPL